MVSCSNNVAPKAPWSYFNPVHIHFGRGVRQRLVGELVEKRCLIVTTERGRRQFTGDPILSSLAKKMEIFWLDSVKSNPGIAELQGKINFIKGQAYDAVIAFGGGSAIDSAKVMAVALSESGTNTSLKKPTIISTRFE